MVSVSTHDKLLRRFLREPSDFSYSELRRLLNHWGYREAKSGHSSGSRAAFIHDGSGHIIRLHRPHPTDVLKRYQVRLIIQELTDKGVIEP